MAITYVKLQPCQSNNSEAALSSDRLSSCNDNGAGTSEVFILAATGMCRDFTRAMILCLMAMRNNSMALQSIYRYVCTYISSSSPQFNDYTKRALYVYTV